MIIESYKRRYDVEIVEPDADVLDGCFEKDYVTDEETLIRYRVYEDYVTGLLYAVDEDKEWEEANER